jgi:hypothetical protein
MANYIDPGFQGAPLLKDEFNPVEFMQGLKDKQFAVQKELYERGQAETEKGLDDNIVKLKAWEDNKGFDELHERNNHIQDVYMKARKMGMELNNPKTSDEVKLYKYINDYHAETAKLADQWNSQKAMYDNIQKLHEQEMMLPKEERKVNWDETQKNLANVLNTKKITERGDALQNAIVYNPVPADYNKIIKDNMDRITTPPVTQIKTTDANGAEKYVMQKGVVTPDIVEKNKKEFRNIYRTMTQSQKEGLDNLRKNDPDDQPNADGIKMSPDEYLYSLYRPEYKQEYIEKPATKGGGLSINVGGQHVKLEEPGTRNNNTIKFGTHKYDDHVDFDSKNTINVNLSDMGVKGIIGENEREVKRGNNTPCELLHYLPKDDSFVFRAKGPATGSDVMDKETFIVPRNKLPDGFMDLKVIVDGKETTLRDIVAKQPQVKTIGGQRFDQ